MGISYKFSFSLFVLCLIAYTASAYTVYRDVTAYGAKGDGVTDDSAAIILALTDGRGVNGSYPNASYPASTQTPAYVYFPPGTYLISETLPIVYYTEVVGNVTNIPTIKYVSTKKNQIVLDAFGKWYPDVNQNNFFRQIRNFVIDMTQCTSCTGVHWEVAQATSITNVYFNAGVGTQNKGMNMEDGSGGFFSDLVFEGGAYGLTVGNQQFTTRNITIISASVAGISLAWDWVWTFHSLNITNCSVGITLGGSVGSIAVIDSYFAATPVAISTGFKDSTSVNSVLLENVEFVTSSHATIVRNSNSAVLTAASTTHITLWTEGTVWYKDLTSILGATDLSAFAPKRPGVLVDGNGNYFALTRPQYPGVTQIDVTTVGVVADGTDISIALQKALTTYAGTAVLYFPHGTYMIGSTVVIPPGSRLVGEAWSILMANGAAFSNASNPTPVLQVGTPGQTGIAQLVGLLLSTYGPQPGAVLIEWNMADPSGAPGSCGMWDTHFRVGGANGTLINPTNCPNDDGTNSPASQCTGAWGLLHITSTGTAYLEGVWGWTADHDIDFVHQINVYNGRGLLVESQGPVWLYGTAFEHNILYQYNFYKAQNVFMGAIQTESPYFQPSAKTPFSSFIGHYADPTFCTDSVSCDISLALVITQSQNLFLYSAGLYSWYNIWTQDCLNTKPTPSCQVNITYIDTQSTDLYFFNYNTYGSVYTLSSNFPFSQAVDNLNWFCAGATVNLNYFPGDPTPPLPLNFAPKLEMLSILSVTFFLLVISLLY